MNEEELELPFNEEDLLEVPTEETTEQANEVVTEEGTENEESKLIDYFNSKEIKYNGEVVKVDSMDKVIDTYQKGLNYDNLKAKTEKSENAVMNYINAKAKSMNMTAEQYINRVQEYEQEQIKAKNEQAIESMVANGVPEEVAREVIETRALRESLQKEKAELEESRKTKEAEEKKDKEFDEFLKAYPDIEVDKIPAEVFENAKNSNLKTAYAEYENKLLKEKLKTLEQNQKNASSSVVTSVTGTGTVEQTSKDAFLLGFESE